MQKKSVTSRISELTSIDFHVCAALLYRLWSIIAGVLLIFIIPIFLTESMQGYYFTFSSLIALQIFFELGFNFVVVQMIAHEMPNVKINKNNRFEGDLSSISRIYSLISLLKKWYRIISLFFFIMVFFVGLFFFQNNGSLAVNIWLPTWTILVLFSSINLFISPFMSVLEGVGLVGQVATIRLIQSIIGYFILIILFLNQIGLIAIVAVSGSAAIVSMFYIFKVYRKLLFVKNEPIKLITSKISWRKEIFPFQWRIALSWLSGYLIFHLFNPMIFLHQGAVEAGKLGLTLTIFSTMLSLSMSWIAAKSPAMAKLIAERKKNELNCLFKSVAIKSGFLNICVVGGFVLFVYIMQHYDVKIINRISDFNILLTLLIVSIINHMVFSAAMYMRAHKEEPMMWNSLVVGVVMLPLIFFFSKISSFATVLSYFFVLLFISLPWCVFIFRRYYYRQYINN